MRDALSLTDQAIAFGAGQLSHDSVRQMLGGVDRTHVLRLIEALADGDGRAVVGVVEQLRVNGLNPASVLEDMAGVLQRMAVHQAVPGAADDDADPDAQDAVRLAQQLPPDETQLLYSICLHGATELGLAPDEYAALTMVLLRLLAFKPASRRIAVQEKKTLIDSPASATALPLAVAVKTMRSSAPAASLQRAAAGASNVHSLTGNLEPVGVAPPAKSSTPNVAPVDSASGASPVGRRLSVVQSGMSRGTDIDDGPRRGPQAADGPGAAADMLAIPVLVQSDSPHDAVRSDQAQNTLVPTEEGDFWFATVQQLIAGQAVTALGRELALQSQLVGRDTDQWLLKVEREALQQAGSRERLTVALQAAGHAVQLVVEVGRVTDSPARRLAAAAAERQLAAEKIIFDDPFVQTMLRDFGAKIVAGSIRPL